MHDTTWVLSELETLRHHWGSAYDIGVHRGTWQAARRDTREVLTAEDPDALFQAIRADYAASPVPRQLTGRGPQAMRRLTVP